MLRLFDLKAGHVSPGACTWTMPASRWLESAPDLSELSMLAETALMAAALTTVGPAQDVRAVTFSAHHQRPPRPLPGRFVARARVVSASRFFVFATVELEDAEGRRITDVQGHFAIESVRPTPPEPPERDALAGT